MTWRRPLIACLAWLRRRPAGWSILGGPCSRGIPRAGTWRCRRRLPPQSPWHAGERGGSGGGRAVLGVVALAAVCELAWCYELGLGGQAAGALMGGGPSAVPDRYRQADPAGLVPVGGRVRLVHGTADDVVPCQMSERYAERARAARDDVACSLLPGAGHFDVIDPLSAWWSRVEAAFLDAQGAPD
jgi:pimeloyl-ACP methyl ester carboxylesterase